jgi:hypothetical protein
MMERSNGKTRKKTKQILDYLQKKRGTGNRKRKQLDHTTCLANSFWKGLCIYRNTDYRINELKKGLQGCWLDSSGSGEEQVTDAFGQCNKLPVSMKCGKFHYNRSADLFII